MLQSRLDRAPKSASATCVSVLQIKRSDRRAGSLMAPASGTASFCGIFVERTEAAQGYGKPCILCCAKRIKPKRVLKPGDNDGEAQRVQARIHENQVIGQRGQFAILLAGDLRELR